MQTVVITRPGGPDVLAVEDRPVPTPGLGEVLVRVFGLVGGGAYAEYVVAHERTAVRIPDALVQADARPGDAVLVHAVASGVGLGAVRPTVDRIFPLAEPAEAHRYLETDASTGKVVLRVLA